MGVAAQSWLPPSKLGGELLSQVVGSSAESWLHRASSVEAQSSERYINVPLQSTYDAAFAEMPEYWRKVLDNGSNGKRKSKR